MKITSILMSLFFLVGCRTEENSSSIYDGNKINLLQVDSCFYTQHYYVIEDDTTYFNKQYPSELFKIYYIREDFISKLYYNIKTDSVYIVKLENGMGMALPINDSLTYTILPQSNNNGENIIISHNQINYYNKHSEIENDILKRIKIKVELSQLRIDKSKLKQFYSLIDTVTLPIFKYSIPSKAFIPIETWN